MTSSKEVTEDKEISEALTEAQSEAAAKPEAAAKEAEEVISFETKNEKAAQSKSAIKDIETSTPVEEDSSNLLLFVAIGVVALLILGGVGFFIYKKRISKASSNTGSTFDSGEDVGFENIEGFNDSGELSDDAFADSELDAGAKNVLTEADTYISFNRYTQAIDLLKKAINSGNDDIAVKIKLLQAYAGVGDRGAFDDLSEDVLNQDGSKESVIEKLASQMKSDKKQSFDMEATTRMNASDFDLDSNSDEEEFDISLDDLANDLDSNFSSEPEEDLGSLDLSEEFEESFADTSIPDTKKGGLDLDDTLVMHSQTVKIAPKNEDLELDLDLDDLSFDDDSSSETESVGLDLSDDDGLDLDFDMDDELDATSSTQVKTAVESSDDLDLDLGEDFSFDELKKSDNNDELDLSSDFDLDSELDLGEDSTVESKDSSSSEDSLFSDSDSEDFDLPDDGDEAATKLDLARAYIDMGDEDGAKDILQEVIAEGDASQKAEAKQLLAKL